jgi:hypothetical protein
MEIGCAKRSQVHSRRLRQSWQQARKGEENAALEARDKPGKLRNSHAASWLTIRAAIRGGRYEVSGQVPGIMDIPMINRCAKAFLGRTVPPTKASRQPCRRCFNVIDATVGERFR